MSRAEDAEQPTEQHSFQAIEQVDDLLEAEHMPVELNAISRKRQAQDPDPQAGTEANAQVGSVPLTTRITALERRIVALEGNSGKGRADLKNKIATLKLSVETVKAGGAGSLSHTAERVAKAENTIVSLEGAFDKQNADLKG